MNLTIRFLGCEWQAITTDSSDDERPPFGLGDATSTPIGFTQREPLLTDGRYGFDD